MALQNSDTGATATAEKGHTVKQSYVFQPDGSVKQDNTISLPPGASLPQELLPKPIADDQHIQSLSSGIQERAAMSMQPQSSAPPAGANPQLTPHPLSLSGDQQQPWAGVASPLGEYTDPEFEAAWAHLNTQYARGRRDIGLGIAGDQAGMAANAASAAAERAELQSRLQQQLREIFEAAVQRQTVFSGRRTVLSNEAREMANRAMAAISARVSASNRQYATHMQGLQNDYSDMYEDYGIDFNGLVAEAITRRMSEAPVGNGSAPPGGNGGTTGTSGGAAPVAAIPPAVVPRAIGPAPGTYTGPGGRTEDY